MRILKKYYQYKFPKEIKWSARILIFALVVGVFGKFIANDVPIIGKKDGSIVMPVFKDVFYDLGIFDWKDRYTYNHLDNDYDFAIRPLIPYSSTYMDNKNAGYVSPFARQDVRGWYHRHWLGTDDLGRDVFAGLINGTWIALLVSLFSVIIALIIGVPIGLLAGFYGDKGFKISWLEIIGGSVSIMLGLYYATYFCDTPLEVFLLIIIVTLVIVAARWINQKIFSEKIGRYFPVDAFFNKIIEVFKSIPTLIILFIFLGVLGNSGILSMILVIGCITWVRISRYIRAETLAIKNNDYIKSLKAMGSSDREILLKHILPLVFPPVIVSVIFLMGSVILLEATLSFFGIGLSVEEVSWGRMLNEARKYFGAWWLALFPGLTLFSIIAALGNLGQYATKMLNPRLRD